MAMLPEDKKRLRILLGVGGGLIALILVAKVVTADDPSPTESNATGNSSITRVSSTTVGSGTNGAGSSSTTSALSPDEFTFEQARNPFARPVDPTFSYEPGLETSSTSSPDETTSTTSTEGSAMSSTTTAFPNFDPSPTTTISYVEHVVGPPESARLQVGDTLVSAVPGDVVGGRFTLVSMEGTCATLRSNDLPFSICVGQALLK